MAAADAPARPGRGRLFDARPAGVARRPRRADTNSMSAEFKRPLMIAAAALLMLIVLFAMMPRPHAVAVKDTPLAPTQAIPAAQDASAISQDANAQIQAAAEAASR